MVCSTDEFTGGVGILFREILCEAAERGLATALRMPRASSKIRGPRFK